MNHYIKSAKSSKQIQKDSKKKTPWWFYLNVKDLVNPIKIRRVQILSFGALLFVLVIGGIYTWENYLREPTGAELVDEIVNAAGGLDTWNGIENGQFTRTHNLYDDNGLKLFGPDGLKLSDKIQKKIENLIDLNVKKHLSNPKFLGRVKRLETGTDDYLAIIKKKIPKSFKLKNMKIVLDCANGAGYKSAPKMLKTLGAKLTIIGDKPNGFNINKNCGSTYPNTLQRYVKKYKADLGISLDGDADRIIMCDEKGSIIDGDQIIAALAVLWKKKRILKGGVVGTLMSNYGLEDFFKRKKIKFIRANVGDRYVKEIMQKKKFNLGGEQSGHIILGKFATTGDGLLVALEVIQALNGKIKASNFFDVFEKIPQVLVNIKIKDENILKKFSVKNSIKIANKLIKGHGRILVRKSGTEAKIRIMGESKNKVLLNKCIKNIAKTIN